MKEPATVLRAVYRSYGGENLKNRPPYYSKRLALLSFIRAVRQVEAEVLFVNDGPVPEDIERLMRREGEVVQLPGPLGMRASYVYGLGLAGERNWPDRDVVWFSEDDYFYRLDAFTALDAAAREIPDGDYFALYGPTRTHPSDGVDHDLAPLPRGFRIGEPVLAGGHPWVRLVSTASTFGGRAAALRADQGVFRFCMVPHKKMYRDHDTAVVLQGFEPHPYGVLLRRLLLAGGGTLKERVRDAGLAPFLLATNLRSHRRPENRRRYYVADPNLACHVEVDVLSRGTDWAKVAAEVQEWALAEGLLDASGNVAPTEPAGA